MTILKDYTYKKIFQSEKQLPDNTLYEYNINVPHIFVEKSSCSIIAGIDKTIDQIKSYFSENNMEYELVEVGSKGLCEYDPVVSIQVPGRAIISLKNIYSNIVDSVLDSILNNILPERELIIGQYSHPELNSWSEITEISDIPFFKKQTRRLLKDIGNIDVNSIKSYLDYGGYKSFGKILTTHTHSEVCDIIEQSELRGRGGGGFYTGLKWKNTLNNNAEKKYFICNADESDPGSFAGRMLIEGNPHLLIEGILIGTYAINANEAIIYIRNTFDLAIKRLKNAIKQAEISGLAGEDIFGSGINIHLSVFASPGAYVCGEETALISSLEGHRGMPSPKPPYPSEYGLFGYPTVVNNVETLCNIPYIIKEGPEKFKELGSQNSYGTKLFSVSGKVDFTGMVEMEMGQTPNDILDITKLQNNPGDVKAIHIGGPSGGFIHPDDFNMNIDFDTFNNNNMWFGSGSFLVLDEENCIVDVTKYYIDFINNESCGKCIPCREGSQRLLEILTRITERPRTNKQHETLLRFKGVTQMEEVSKLMKETSLCGLGQNAPNSIISGLKYFRQEYEEHIYEKRCDAVICRNLKEYSINVDNCVGCSICSKRCPSDAVIGSQRTAHFIIQERCIKCGICESVCKFNAIIVR
ncbi:MAG: 4Fe-4S binding protein [Bacteroidales bacterium]|jgi:NADH:ubiquinone oxidoreductase subunit F (NADH-binding)|nr:4Fe-4S binding protein [Bacteroidales bacterium]